MPNGHWAGAVARQRRLADASRMTALVLLDAAGRRRSPATMPPATGRPARAHERWSCCSGGPGRRISEALALAESDLDRLRGAVLVRHGKGDKRREMRRGFLWL